MPTFSSSNPSIPPAYLAALLEASVAASNLVPFPLRSNLILFRSAAMLYHGARRKVGDLDFVSTLDALFGFLEGAKQDERFSVIMDGAFIQYTALRDAGASITVKIDLVELGAETIPSLKYEPILIGEVHVASMPELWRMKARAFINRAGDNKNDLPDFVWLSERMAQDGIEYDPMELLDMILAELAI